MADLKKVFTPDRAFAMIDATGVSIGVVGEVEEDNTFYIFDLAPEQAMQLAGSLQKCLDTFPWNQPSNSTVRARLKEQGIL